ncbi:MAG: hypothetical protein LDLANPLL_01670 [Turneriella sp.]|nr:hypothetical protein [Turneriella sp.]
MKTLKYFPFIFLILFFACGKKKDGSAKDPQPAIAYAVYGTGVYNEAGGAKPVEYLNRAEMVTVLNSVTVETGKKDAPKKTWAKIERTTGKQGFVDAANLAAKAFVVVQPLEVFNVNQASGKRLATVPVGQVGFIVEEKAGWAKVRFGYRVSEDWSLSKEATKWLDEKWAQVEGVSYDAAAIGQGVELETALRKFADANDKKKTEGKAELEKIVKEERSQFIEVARKVLALSQSEVASPEKKEEPVSPPSAPQGNE